MQRLPRQEVEPSLSQFTNEQLLQLIKKKPLSQSINGVQFTFSILKKKQRSFMGTNDRFLLLKGIESISYARNLPENTELPFKNAASLPLLKVTYSLIQIQSILQDSDILRIQFAGKEKEKWEFECPSRMCALDWKKRIESAVMTLSEFKRSKFQKFEDYLVFKQSQSHQKEGNMYNKVNTNFQPISQLENQKQTSITNKTTTFQNIPSPYSNDHQGFSLNGQQFTHNIQENSQGSFQYNMGGHSNQPQQQEQMNWGLSGQGQPQLNFQLHQPTVSVNNQLNANFINSQDVKRREN